jgi:aryl-alcohol dehydrogenase-like predicted oxidoreductase
MIVRLGNSGLKVSKIILGTMQYGDKKWAEWVLDEEEAIKHIKIASVFISLPSTL